MEITPITLAEANQYVAEHHRHHKPVPGAKFSIAAREADKVVGVVIVGRPVSIMLDKGWTLEVNRLCTDGSKNACSMLYGAAWRAAKAMGYRQLITYTLPEEGGGSLRASTILQQFNEKWTPHPRTGCWFWTASLTTTGYGQFKFNGKPDKAHRIKSHNSWKHVV